MMKVNFFSSFWAVLWFGVSQGADVNKFPAADYEFISNNGEIQSNDTAQEIHLDGDDEEAVYDDYIRIHIYKGAELRSALRNGQLWDNGIVPYEISNDYKPKDRQFILNAMEEFHNRTCVQFKRRKDEKSYISIMPGSGCSAVLGNATMENRVTLGRNCFVKGIVIHELMHSLGFIHEQNRPDRDEFIQIIFDNIKEGFERNFDKLSADRVQTFNLTYDYGSVMHYGAFEFAKNRSLPTIKILKEGVEIGQRRGFSEIDLIKINLLYNCGNNTRNSDYVTDETSTADEKIGEKEVVNEGRRIKIKMKMSRLFFYFAKLFG